MFNLTPKQAARTARYLGFSFFICSVLRRNAVIAGGHVHYRCDRYQNRVRISFQLPGKRRVFVSASRFSVAVTSLVVDLLGQGLQVFQGYSMDMRKQDMEAKTRLLQRLSVRTDAVVSNTYVVGSACMGITRPLADPKIAEIKEQWKNQLPVNWSRDFDNWHWSLDAEGDLLYKGLLVYVDGERKTTHLTRDLVKAMILDVILNRIPNGLEEPIYGDLEDDKIGECLPRRSATGYLPEGFSDGLMVPANATLKTHSFFHTLGFLLNEFAERLSFGSGSVGIIPNRNVPKGEVIAKGKKLRYIQVSSSYWVMLMSSTVERFSKFQRCLSRGNTIGLSMKYGGVLQLYYTWALKMAPIWNVTAEAAFHQIMSSNLIESDQKAWERNTIPEGAFLCVILWLLQICYKQPGVHFPVAFASLLSEMMAAYVYPSFMIPGEKKCYSILGVVASGIIMTGSFSTTRHCMRMVSFRHFIKSHDFHLGRVDCACGLCHHLPVAAWVGTGVTSEQYAILDCYGMLGDDFIGLDPGPLVSESYVWFVTHIWGGEVEFRRAKACGEVVDGECETAEFLRMGVTKVGKDFVQVRDRKRLLAKLYHGTSTIDILPACVSAMYNCGGNLELYLQVKKLFDMVIEAVDRVQLAEYDVEQLASDSRNPFGKIGLTPTIVPPTWVEVLAFNSLSDKAKRRVKTMAETAALYNFDEAHRYIDF